MSGATKTIPTGPNDMRQRSIDTTEMHRTIADAHQATINTAMPGIIVSYDAAKMTARVTPAIQANQMNQDGTITPTQITDLPDVPVHFPGGGGHTLTFPVKAGDDCLLVFSQRSIDFWHQLGGVQKQVDRRMHDINDAICLVGVRSQPALPSGGASPTSVQLRSDDGRMVVDLNPETGSMSLKSPMEVHIDSPLLRVSGQIRTEGGTGSADIISQGNFQATGEITAKAGTAASVTVSQHRHPAVNTPPTPGT